MNGVNVNKGNIEGINGTINIKAYVDSSNILISDTYPEGATTINGVEYYNGTPTTNKTVLTTEEWNSITGTNALSFKIKVEAREGIWVEKPSTPSSCFTTSEPVAKYVRNPNMDINTCVSKFTEMGFNESLQEGETLEAFCNGTGTNMGVTLQEGLDRGLRASIIIELETAGIIIPDGYTTTITDYDASCGSDVVIPSKINAELVTSYTRNPNMDINACVNKFTEMGWDEYLEEGETLEAYCNGTGTNGGNPYTLEYEIINEFSSSQLIELETAGIIIPNTTSVQASVTEIGENSFKDKNLTSVVIPDSVTTIERSSFQNNQLTNIKIGDRVISIGDNAFENNQLTKVNIPDSTTTIGDYAFNDNLELNEIIVSDALYASLVGDCNGGLKGVNFISQDTEIVLKNSDGTKTCSIICEQRY